MRTPVAATVFTCSLWALSGCLDIERTEPQSSSSGGAGGALSATGGASLDPAFMPTACVQQCVDKTPDGAVPFSGVSACFDHARAGACADACNGTQTGEAPPSTCAIPSSIDPNPACNNCIKDSCCDKLMACFVSSPCITVGICASGCNG